MAYGDGQRVCRVVRLRHCLCLLYTSALAVLGYGSAEIAAALKDIDMEALTLEDIIRQALKRMMK